MKNALIIVSVAAAGLAAYLVYLKFFEKCECTDKDGKTIQGRNKPPRLGSSAAQAGCYDAKGNRIDCKELV